MRLGVKWGTGGLFAAAALASVSSADHQKDISLAPLGSYASGVFNGAGSEIAAYDARSHRLFITNIATGSIDIVDISDPAQPTLVRSMSVSAHGPQPNSVAVHRGLVAATVQAPVKTDPGTVLFLDVDGNILDEVTVGALPDMVTFTPDGRKVLVANEGEPNDDYTIDPEGTISIIDVDRSGHGLDIHVRTVGFTSFNAASLDPSIRIFGPGATVAQDLEPEYITVSDDSDTAWVTLQENNAIAEVDLGNRRVTRVFGLGFKDHSQAGRGLDASDRDGPSNTPLINIAQWPVLGMYMPDAIASYQVDGRTYLVTVNEGDARDYDGFAEEVRVSALTLDPTAFPDAAALKTNAQLGRLTVTSAGADTDNDGDADRILAFGARSFSIWKTDGRQVFDSGEALERITADALPLAFNSDHVSNTSFDTRSDNKGPEPEGVTVEKLFGRWYAFMALERIGGIVVYDVTEPGSPRFVQYVNSRNFAGDPAAGTAGDLGPEGVLVIQAHESPTQRPLLVVANEISGTTTVFTISKD
jgi:hypothetical protein